MTSMNWRGTQAKATVHEAAAQGVSDAMKMLFDETQQAVPEATGALRRSGRIVTDKDGLHAEIQYGQGLPDNRAIAVHERMDLQHSRGSAKYLENPINAAAPKVAPVIADSIRSKLD